MPLISIGQILDRSVHHYAKYFIELMSISAWLLIIVVLNVVSTWFYPSALNQVALTGLGASEWFGIILYSLTFFVATPVISLWVSNNLMMVIDRQDQGQPVNLKAIGRQSWRLFFPRLLVSVLVGLIYLAILLVFVPGVIMLIAAEESAVIPGLAALFLIGGIFIGIPLLLLAIVRLFFAPFALVLDGHHGRQALQASDRLVQGRWLSTLVRLFIPQLIFYLGFFLLQAFLLFVLKQVILTVAGLNVDLAIRLYSIGSGTIFILLTILITPLALTAATLLYKSLRSAR